MKRSLITFALIVILLVPPDTMPRGYSAQAATWQSACQADLPARPRYTITDLGTLAGGENGSSQAFGISKKGLVVGLSMIDPLYYHAFLWENDSMTDLGTLGGQQSNGLDVNNAGQVVGRSHIPDGNIRAFLWENGSMQNLGTLGGLQSSADGINNSGQVVGFAEIIDNTDPQDPVYYPHAFLWQNGAMQDLGTLGGMHSWALDINDAVQVVGQAELGGTGDPPGHAFLWQSGSMQDLGTLGGDASLAFGIAYKGHDVGPANLDPQKGDTLTFLSASEYVSGTFDYGEISSPALGYEYPLTNVDGQVTFEALTDGVPL